MSYLKHSYETQYLYNSIMKKACFKQNTVFDSVMDRDRVQLVKIPCGYLKSEVQTFNAQDGFCCA